MASSVKKHRIETKLAISKVKLAKTGNSLNTLRSRFNRNTHSWFSPSHLLTPTSLAFGAILSTIILSIPLLAPFQSSLLNLVAHPVGESTTNIPGRDSYIDLGQEGIKPTPILLNPLMKGEIAAG